jgi:hypothetical protein
MLRIGTFEGRVAALASAGLMAVVAAYALPKGALPHFLVVCAFGAAILNIVISEQKAGAPTVPDLALVFITGFAASSFGVESVAGEFLQAVLRMALLASAVGALAWTYQRLRGSAGVSATDIVLVAILGAFLPLAVAIYALAISIVLAIAMMAALQLFRKDTLALQDQVPIASTLSVCYFCVWAAYRLVADAPLQ